MGGGLYMILSMSAQAAVFLWLVAAGAAAGLLFDGFRALRRVFSHPDALTWLEDMLYWAAVFGLVFYLLITRNGGEMRAFVLLGLALGMILYFAACSRFVLAFLVLGFGAAKKVLGTVLMIVTWPVRFLGRILRAPMAKCRKIVKKRAISVKKLLHKVRIYVRIKVRLFSKDTKAVFKKV